MQLSRAMKTLKEIVLQFFKDTDFFLNVKHIIGVITSTHKHTDTCKPECNPSRDMEEFYKVANDLTDVSKKGTLFFGHSACRGCGAPASIVLISFDEDEPYKPVCGDCAGMIQIVTGISIELMKAPCNLCLDSEKVKLIISPYMWLCEKDSRIVAAANKLNINVAT